ncbi:MAG: hypothetical protein ABSE70_05750 [Candidatus Limnocylindrales bacterium]
MDSQADTQMGRLDDLDFLVEVRASSLRHCRDRLASLQRSRFSMQDLCLAICTLAAGATLGAVEGGLTTVASLGWLFYSVMPAIAAAGLVAYVLLGLKFGQETAANARDVLEDLPDPDDTRPSHREYAKLAGQWDIDSTTTTSHKVGHGELTFTVRQTTITVSGVLYGSSDTKIAEISSRFASYDPAMKRLMLIYGYSAANDGGRLDSSECVLSGVVFAETPDLTVRGNWYHLTGPTVAGTVTLRKRP